MRALYLLILAIACIPANAQEYTYPNDTSYYLHITAAQVLDFEESYKYLLPASLKDAPRYAGDTVLQHLPYGHYLLIRTNRLSAKAEHVQHFPYQVWVGSQGKRIAVGVYGKAGEAISNASVRVDHKKLRWSGKDSLYMRRDWKVEKMQLFIDNDTLFYDLRHQQRNSKIDYAYQRLRRTELGRILLYPVHLVDKTVIYLDRVIEYGDWRMHSWPFKRRYRSIYGYVTSSQPSYRPGDTVRVSVYCSTYKGRPIRKKPRIELNGMGLTERPEVHSLAPGHYEIETVVGDDWPLDRNINVNVYWPKNRSRNYSPLYNFKLEDYQLDEYELAIDAPERVLPAEVLTFKITAKDVNDRPVNGGRLNLTLMLDRLLSTDPAHEAGLNDTLWTKELILGRETDLEQIVPDSLLPDSMNVELNLYAELYTAGGEQQEAEANIRLDRRRVIEGLSLRYEDGQLIVDGPRGQAATLHYADGEEPLPHLPDTIALPSARKLLSVRSADLKWNIQSSFLKDQVQKDLGWPGIFLASPQDQGGSDTIEYARLFLPKPTLANLDFRWSVTTPDGRLLASGLAVDLPTVVDLDKKENRVWVNYQRRLSGQWIYGKQPLSWVPEQLAISIEQPELIQPGEEVDIKVKVSDQQGRPVRGAALSSATYNARFEEAPRSEISAKTGYSRYQRNFSLSEGYRPVKSLWVDTNLIHVLDWAEWPVAQLHYPPAGGYSHYRHLPEESLSPAELAVFCTWNYGLVKIHAISIDGEVRYLDAAWGSTPYAIPLDTGQHKIEVRLTSKVYTKTIEAKPGQQLVLSFDTRYAGSAGWTETERGKFPTDYEWRQIKARLLAFQTSSRQFSTQPIWAARPNGQVFFRRGAQRHGYLGLFDANDKIDLIASWVDSTQFKFEPGFSYDIRPDRDRLYPLAKQSFYTNANTQDLPGFANYELPKRAPGYYKVIDSLWADRVQTYHGDWPIMQLIDDGTGEYHMIDIMGVDTSFLVSYPENSKFQLPSGTYRLRLFSTQDSVVERIVELAATSDRQLVSLQHPDWQKSFLSEELQREYYELVKPGTFYVAVAPKRSGEILYSYSGVGGINGRVIDEDDGQPLIGAAVAVYDRNGDILTGTVTDLDGYFRLPEPDHIFDLEISYTGYMPKRLEDIKNVAFDDLVIQLGQGDVHLQEVVVVGYGYRSHRNHTEPALLMRRSRENENVYYVDGIRVQGNLIQESELSYETTAAQTIVNTRIIRRLPTRNISALAAKEVGLSIAGEANGFQINSLGEYGTNTYLNSGDQNLRTIRSSFSDAAHFEPYLMTDENGEASFRIRFPDDVTAWNTFAIGQDRRRRAGMGQVQTRSFLPVQAQLYLPRFLVAGDQSEALALALNQTNDSLEVNLNFTAEGEEPRSERTVLSDFLERSYTIAVDANQTDSLSYRFELDSERAYDGEARKLAVYPQGTEVCVGSTTLLGRESLDLTAGVDPSLGDLEVMITRRPGRFVDRDIERLRDYPYACNEQLVGRIIAQMATLPAGTEADDWPRSLIKDFKLLEKRQRADGGYGWWPASQEAQPWISLHAMRAMLAAQKLGYESDAFGQLRTHLLAQIGVRPRQDERGSVSPLPAQLLLALAESGPINDLDHRLAWVDTLAKIDDYYQLVSWRIRQLQGQEIPWQSVDSLGKEVLGGGRYWEPTLKWSGRQPLGSRLAATLLAYQILTDENREAEAESALFYLLGQGDRQGYLGRNGLESGILVLGLKKQLITSGFRPTSKTRSDSESYTISVANDGAFEPMTITNDGFPILISRRQCRWVQNPVATGEGLAVSTDWSLGGANHRLRETASTSGSANKTTTLPLEETAYIEADLRLDAPADYVLLEIPIPAGAEYADRDEASGPGEVHREYRRNRVAVFIDHLEAGTYRYRVALDGRFAGQYTQNPPRVELQYSPAVQANGELKFVVIE
ncbi:MAG: alpha-2-macroglobulin family protein [Bacteroidota bacterium]